MSKYTTEVRSICESYLSRTEHGESIDVNEIITSAMPLVFDFDFPIFDEAYRGVLERKILRHFWMREIGVESVGLWKLYLENKLNEIMPFYNQLYKSQLLEFNPLYDVDYTKTGNRDGSSNSSGNSTTEGEAINKFSDTPQNGLNDVFSDEYLTSATVDQENSNNTTRTDATTSEEYFERIQGKMGVTNYSRMLLDFRKTFLNIDADILNDLEPLFMQIW